MATRCDKVLVTNLTALRQKYGKGFATVRAAIDDFVKADAKRGLVTALVGIDQVSVMRRLKAPPVTKPIDPRQSKAAVDGVVRALRPDYVVILGAIDVVPHQDMRNPAYASGDDDDRHAFGDLPYACDAPYSRDPAHFRTPTRVVGRIPDVAGQSDPRYLVKLLEIAAGYRKRPRSDYQQYLGITAEVWKASTSLSLTNLFGGAGDLKTSPPGGPRWAKALMRRRAHFINCHGAAADPFFYGQSIKNRNDFPQAHAADYVRRPGNVAEGTVIAAECCYGAELYDPAEAKGRLSIGNSYLVRGAYGYFGSSTIAYGPEEGNGQADLICQYFLERVLRGASLGRAVLEARQQFIQAADVLDPTDLKTLAQFSLLGDPSVHAVERAAHALSRSRTFDKTFSGPEGAATGRGQRREWLIRNGLRIGEMTGTSHRRTRLRPSPSVRAILERAGREAGLWRVQVSSHVVRDPLAAHLRSRRRDRRRDLTVHVGIGSKPRDAREGRGPRHVVAIVALVENNRVVRLRRLQAR